MDGDMGSSWWHYLHTCQPRFDTRCLITFICNEWGYGSIIMPLQPHLLVQIWEVGTKLVVTAGCQMKPKCICWGSKPTSNGSHIHSNICKVYDNQNKQWVGIWIHHDCITSTHVGQDFRFGKPVEILVCHCWVAEWRLFGVAETPNPHDMVPTSTPIIYKVFGNLHMQWMGI